MAGEFEDSPNMVPGDVETAETITRPVDSGRPRNQKTKLIFAVVALAVAGGWSYANQDNLKGALGYQAASQCSASQCSAMQSAAGFQGCGSQCPSEARMAAMEGDACPMALTSNGEMAGTCCENGKKNAMMAALLAPVEEQATDEASEAASLEETAETDKDAEVSQPDGIDGDSAETAQEISAVE
ncbi:hypothetical protein [Rubinisphaera sp. JC750]|uniref:hypothetical protein n=1 Tax=Rubinisphaera sp. JC750 TaxID=2898658 RepID=UPI001F36D360|nr:hypothetical protein [Rubinisphaera sp. JC750]